MPDRPNIIVITTHDTGRHFGCYGIETVHTPNIDAMAADGVRLTNYFAASPICCAARAAMMTGQHPQTNGQMDLCFQPFNYDLNDYRTHASHRFADAGYHSMLFGMQHETAHVEKLGYHEQRATDRPMPIATTIAEAVADYLKSDDASGEKPFFPQVGFFETHSPFDWRGIEPDDSKGVTVPPYVRDNETARRVMAQFQGAVRRVDDAVGIILQALRDSGLEQNTLVVFTVDHGLEVPRAKWHLYNPGLEVAMILRWPGGNFTGGHTCDWLLSQVDFLPTVMELAGMDIPSDIEGKSFATGLRADSNAPPPNSEVFGMMNRSASRCVRNDRYKLIRTFSLGFMGIPGFYLQYSDESMNVAYPGGQGHMYDFSKVALYDLETDPLEFDNIAGSESVVDVQKQLEDKLWRWMESVNDPLLDGPPRPPYYDDAVGDYHDWQRSRDADG